MARPRKKTYTLDMYLKKNMKGDIDNNADVQRNFVWNNEQVNELIVTILTDDYIPPIILGEEDNSRLHIVDGGQRTFALIKYRYGNYKITPSIENPLIPYKKKVVDGSGNITYEDSVFNIKNKTYEKLPEELKDKFDEYQIETVIHEACDSLKISRYIKRYNNHVAMNTDQKAFTYIDRFANLIRKILDSKFFVECNNYSEKDKIKGVVERIVVESMMCMNHFDHWQTQAKLACKYLNDHATEKEFERFADNLHRLENIITDDIKDIFNKKDSFIFLTLFDKFVRLGIDDEKFAEFLREFQGKLRPVKRNEKGVLFDEIDRNASTKDRQVIAEKLDMLGKLMNEFLHIEEKTLYENEKDLDTLDIALGFIKKFVNKDANEEDVDFHHDNLNAWSIDIPNNSRLFDEKNLPSMIAIAAYAFADDSSDVSSENGVEEKYDDETMKAWFVDYESRNPDYIPDQKENFIKMREDLSRFVLTRQRQSVCA